MTKPKRTYTDKPLTEWNTRDFHAWLADENASRFEVDYQPFGRGSKAQAWRVEQGMLRQAIDKYGAEVLRHWLANQLDSYRSTAQYPCMTFGFVWSYRQNSLPQAQAEVRREQAKAERRQAQSGDLSAEELRKLL